MSWRTALKNEALVTKTVVRIAFLALLAVACGLGGWQWWQAQKTRLPDGLVVANGRIEADQIDISTKSAGRVREVLVREGDLVAAGQVLAKMDTSELEAQRAKYVADVAYAESARLEAEARAARRGLWSQASPIAPWDWRQNRGLTAGIATQVIGNRKSLVYHRATCANAAKMTATNRVTFTSETAAAAAGYRRGRDCFK